MTGNCACWRSGWPTCARWTSAATPCWPRIEEQGKLTDELRAALLAADTKARIEDIYLPYKPKRRTKAQIAREAGLEPLADRLLADPALAPEDGRRRSSSARRSPTPPPRSTVPGTSSIERAGRGRRTGRRGAHHVLERRHAQDLAVVEEAAKSPAGQKFRDYFEFAEPLEKMPSHRVLAVMRGEKEQILALNFDGGDDAGLPGRIARSARHRHDRRGPRPTTWLATTVRLAWRTKLMISAAVDARIAAAAARRTRTPSRCSPATSRTCCWPRPRAPAPRSAWTPVSGPGSRWRWWTAPARWSTPARSSRISRRSNGTPPRPRWPALVARHGVELIAVGNGTASRETDALAAELITDIRSCAAPAPPVKAMVSEAGASVYSASAYAAHELPQPRRDAARRGVDSRRLQDPLAELVKIEPEVDRCRPVPARRDPGDAGAQPQRRRRGRGERRRGRSEHRVGAAAGPGVRGDGARWPRPSSRHRENTGPFRNRSALLEVPRLGPKAFEQCAGFLRITGGDDPLDASGVHPEAYPVVRRILDRSNLTLAEIIGNERTLRAIKPAEVADDAVRHPHRHRYPRRTGEAGPRPAAWRSPRPRSPPGSRRWPT